MFTFCRPGGLSGNDDSGGLSAWYVWASLGLFPVAGQNLFLMFGDGTPSLDDIAIVVTGRNPSTGSSITTGDTVNTGQGGGGTTIGSNNQMVDPGEGIAVLAEAVGEADGILAEAVA